MDARNKNRYRMLTTLQSVFESHKTDNPKTWTGIPALVKAVGDLDAVVASIAVHLEATVAPSGAAKNKATALDAVVPVAVEIAAAVHAFAVDNEDGELAAQLDWSETDIRKQREPQIVAICSKILSLATEQVDDLVDYNITQAKLTAFSKKVDAYKEACPRPRQNVATKSASTKALPRLFAQARTIIGTRVNKLMVQFKTSAPDFFAEYQTARKVVDQPGTQGEDHVTSSVVAPTAATGSPTLPKAA
jgi:hypothetical protein